MDFLATIVHANNKLEFNPKTKFKISMAIVVILKRVWVARCDAIFDHVPIDIFRIVLLVENELKMEIGKLTPSTSVGTRLQSHC